MPETPNEKLYLRDALEPPTAVAPCAVRYAELDVTTNFSFLRGASHPDELVYTAAMLGYHALAITDINSVAGVVRAYEAARKVNRFKLIVGSRLVFTDGTPDLLVWPSDRAAYGRLSLLLTLGRRRAPKGECHLTLPDFLQSNGGMLAAAVIPQPDACNEEALRTLREALGDRFSLAICLTCGGDDESHLSQAVNLGRRTRVPLLATNHVHYHDPGRRSLQDVLTCTRHGCTIQDAGYRLFPNAERYLKSPEQMRRLFESYPAAIRRSVEIAERCNFKLEDLKYEYPTEAVPADQSPSTYLRQLTYAQAAIRYPRGIPMEVWKLLRKELKFICGSKYESYFLTVYDLVRYARSQGILCQGRGSAANSAVCYCLGVTAVDPTKFQLVFERFASAARNEPPDIDIDFEHERREEVIQYVYQKYGRDRAGMTASLITYRGRSAVRDVGKALGLSQDVLDELAGKLDWWHRGTISPSQLCEAGIDPGDATILQLMSLSSQLLGFPRHLSQHVGGMVISKSALCEIVPIENAAMDDRTVIEWDKDDLDVLGIFKVDILALGMLTCISKALVLIGNYAPPLELHTIPSEDEGVYKMISDADTIGVFQIESRAQMSMLPRLRPREFYDLVIEVAIVRPGPIQGDMVHPFLQRREMKRQNPDYEVEYPNDELRGVLYKTLGVPLFQEQAMRIAIVGAGFSGAEADALRRAMAAWKRGAGLIRFHDKFVNGMTGRGYELEFAERCFQQISGFGEYGFPESHAASFALLVYASSWLKRYHPAAFAAALLNSQPMGFYAPAQIVRDAREHGVKVRPVDVNASDWDSTLEYDTVGNEDSAIDCGKAGGCHGVPHPMAPNESDSSGKAFWGNGGPALRLGFSQIKGIRQDDVSQIAAIRRSRPQPFTSVEQFHRASGSSAATIRRLAEADAFTSLGISRRIASWRAMELTNEPLSLFSDAIAQQEEPAIILPTMPPGQEVQTDYATVGLTLRRHPVSFVRSALSQAGIISAAELKNGDRYPHGARVKVAGLVLVRQRPGTASGVVFITLEDETGVANLILWASIYDRYRPAARHATLLEADGFVQREGQVIHVLAKRLADHTKLLRGLMQPSRDFH